ncbi:MAG: SURF1 family protein [Luteimonas sp.]
MSDRRDIVFGWLLALLGIVLFARLGFWQLARMYEKQALLQSAHAVLSERRALPLVAALGRDDGGLRWVTGSGRFLPRPQLLLDNQIRNDRVGVKRYCVLRVDGGARALLVDLGWQPMAGDRALPNGACPSADAVNVRGLLVPPPSSGLRLGPALVESQPGVWLATRIDPAAISDAWHLPVALASQVLRLDPAVPIGYARDLDMLPNTLPPQRHLGYAVQWFGLALTVFVTALVLGFRKSKRRRTP